MFIRLNKSRAQSTAEYAILFAIVIGAFLAMQIYIKRGLQGRIKDVVDNKGAGGAVGGTSITFNSNQYEPYYLQSTSNTSQNQTSNEALATGGASNRSSNQSSNVSSTRTEGWNGATWNGD